MKNLPPSRIFSVYLYNGSKWTNGSGNCGKSKSKNVKTNKRCGRTTKNICGRTTKNNTRSQAHSKVESKVGKRCHQKEVIGKGCQQEKKIESKNGKKEIPPCPPVRPLPTVPPHPLFCLFHQENTKPLTTEPDGQPTYRRPEQGQSQAGGQGKQGPSPEGIDDHGLPFPLAQ